MAGVNYELLPIVRMTAPATWANRAIDDWPTGEHLFTSTLLLFSLIPIDLHRFTLLEVHDTGFRETSSSLVNAQWNHSRTLEVQETGVLVRDVVEYVPRLRFLGGLMLPIYRFVFRHRHRRLKKQYGECNA